MSLPFVSPSLLGDSVGQGGTEVGQREWRLGPSLFLPARPPLTLLILDTPSADRS